MATNTLIQGNDARNRSWVVSATSTQSLVNHTRVLWVEASADALMALRMSLALCVRLNEYITRVSNGNMLQVDNS